MTDVIAPTSRVAAAPEVIRPARVRLGGIFLVVGAVEFLVGMTIAEVGYGPSYSISQNLLSDLGVTGCGPLGGTGPYLCSPWFLAFDAATVLLGFLVVLAAVGVRPAFPPGATSTVGLGLLAFHGIGLIGAGLIPENVSDPAHSAFAVLAFSCGSLALILLGLAFRNRPPRTWFPPYSVVSGLVSAAALLFFVTGADLGLGSGGMERVLVAPVLLWFVLVGVHFARTPRPAVGFAERPVGG